jgi:hypothetical protein
MPRLGCPVLRNIQKEPTSPKFEYPHRLPLLDEHQPVSWCYPQELMSPVADQVLSGVLYLLIRNISI